ncbi:MAG: DMT family transporter [Bacteroidales bacterium]|nr:DMT family transporter [Bacteroidales bacterium]
MDNRPKLSKNAIIGYPAGIISGIAYGLNPLFAMPLMSKGASVESVLFFRYSIAVVLLGLFLCLRKERFAITLKQTLLLICIGLLYTASSLFLFEAYNYIPSGLATTLVFVSPVMVALIMVCLRVVPSIPVWMAIFASFAGVFIMTRSSGTETINPIGVYLSLGSALVYSIFVVIVNKSKALKSLSSTLLTFYSLCVGTVVFSSRLLLSGGELMTGLDARLSWINLIGLALLPTIVSTASLAISSRNIGATKASVLGVFEPITAILIGTCVFAEPLTANIIVGIAISIISVIFMILTTKR